MKTLHSRPTLSVELSQFRGIAPASAPARVRVAAAAPTPAATPRAKPEKRITFAGIGGGGFRQPAVARQSNTEPDAVRIQNQKRVDASWDRATAAVGMNKSDAASIHNQKRIDAMWDQAAVAAGIVKQST